MKSRRSLFGLFGAVAAGATIGAASAAIPEAPKRKFFNGRLICGCEKPEWDAVYEPERFVTTWNWPGYSSGLHAVSPGLTAMVGAVADAGHTHTHTISDAGHSHNISQEGWKSRQARYCAFCGGIPAPAPTAA